MRRRMVRIAAGGLAGVAAVALLAGAAVIPATAATTTTQPFGATADSYVSQQHLRTNYGSNSAMRLGQSPTQRGSVRFAVAGVSGSVTHATLRLYANAASTA